MPHFRRRAGGLRASHRVNEVSAPCSRAMAATCSTGSAARWKSRVDHGDDVAGVASRAGTASGSTACPLVRQARDRAAVSAPHPGEAIGEVAADSAKHARTRPRGGHRRFPSRLPCLTRTNEKRSVRRPEHGIQPRAHSSIIAIRSGSRWLSTSRAIVRIHTGETMLGRGRGGSFASEVDHEMSSRQALESCRAPPASPGGAAAAHRLRRSSQIHGHFRPRCCTARHGVRKRRQLPLSARASVVLPAPHEIVERHAESAPRSPRRPMPPAGPPHRRVEGRRGTHQATLKTRRTRQTPPPGDVAVRILSGRRCGAERAPTVSGVMLRPLTLVKLRTAAPAPANSSATAR